MTNLLRDLKLLVSQFDVSASLTSDDEINELYVDGDFCHVGLTPCDSSKRKCPDEYMNPNIYTNQGLRCNTKLGMSKMKPEENNSRLDIHSLVTQTTQMNELLNQMKPVVAPVPAPATGLTLTTTT